MVINDDEEKATIFNRHFVNKVQRLRKNVDEKIATDPLAKLRHRLGENVPGFDFSDVSVSDVKAVLKRMKKSKAAGIDDLSTFHI